MAFGILEGSGDSRSFSVSLEVYCLRVAGVRERDLQLFRDLSVWGILESFGGEGSAFCRAYRF